ncbi:concanavalin A-like lectin/glucanase superfamily protein [Marinimicrobium koreense]|uniref:Concanavalin A-like lectin/glucanase superfamily protein n=1 Tax=Marinimicrobium koreense TaxID=306545 RepID=A0A3N1NNL2_9GAMM|nr:LamG domain-containing protein [Marinimicrobium koreense]ROQ20422.1 concanavalin A-like lectin/glucanase superfamily protein [Marinimicrobium koreense]
MTPSSQIPKTLILGILVCAAASCSTSRSTPDDNDSTLWRLDRLDRAGSVPARAEGNPTLVDTVHGPAIHFDGDEDRLLVEHNPLAEQNQFTIEVWFNPADVWPANWEPRFFHIESLDNPDRRITVELRLNDQQQWYLDGFLKSERDALTLIDETLVHPVNQWHHAALTFDGTTMRTYVNGALELEGTVDFEPIGTLARTSIGARLNRVHWFNGLMLAVRMTPQALEPEAFLDWEKLPD